MRKHAPGSHRRTRREEGERGAALIFALVGLAALTLLGLGLTSVGMTSTRMTSNERDTQQALALADAGLSHARKLISYQEWDWPNLTPFLTGGDGDGCTGDELSQAPIPPGGAALPADYPTLFIDSPAAGGTVIGTGTYRVYVCDDDLTDRDPTTNVLDADQNLDVNRRILVRAVGTTTNGATATLEHLYAPSEAPAILVNGDLKIRGDVNVMGAGGIIHSNGTTDIVGNSACAQQYFSATEEITGGIPEGGAGCNQPGELRPGSAPITIRNMDAANYRSRAEYILTAEVVGGNTREFIYRNWNYPTAAANDLVTPTLAGVVVPGAAWVRCDATPVDARCTTLPSGWTFNRNSFTWRSNGNVKTTIYYATTHVQMGGNFTTSVPVNAAGNIVVANPPLQTAGTTVLALGSIELGGGATLQAKLNVPGVGLIALLSNQDLNLTGTSGGGGGGANWTGLLYARDQIEITGSPLITGQVVALNAGDPNYPAVAWPGVGPRNPVPLQGGFMNISGTPNINFVGGGMMSTLPRAWRECRADPLNVNPLPGRADDACGVLFGAN